MKNSALLVVLVAVMLFTNLPTINLVLAQAPPITFAVEPEEYYALKKGETFTTNITISNVYAGERLVGVEFRLGYNATLLEVVSVTEGPFFQQFAQSSTPPYTFFVYYIEPETSFPNGTTIPAHVVVGLALMPNATGDWPGPMPDGNGTIAHVTFEAIYQPVEPDPPVNCTLDLFDAAAIDDSKNHLTIKEIDSYYEIITVLHPISTFTYAPLRPIAGQEVVLNATESYDPDGSILWYYWTFEDGTTVNTTDPVITHVFSASGWHDVTLTIKDIDDLTATTLHVLEVGAYAAIEVEIDTNPMHFRGELCEFNILINYLGRPITVDKVSAVLYFNGSAYANLTGNILHISTGYHQIQYTIPGTVDAGAYTLIVKVEYDGMNGIGMSSFYISDNLADMKNTVDSIEQDVITLLTDIGIIKINLTEIHATVESIDGTTATISTDLGELTVDVADLSTSTLGAIDQTDGKVDDVKGTQASILNMLYVTLALAAIAAIMAILTLVLLMKKTRS